MRQGDPLKLRLRVLPLCIVFASSAVIVSCRSAAPPAGPGRLVDLYEADNLHASSTAPPPQAVPRIEWKFDGPAGLNGWKAGPGIKGFSVREGLMTGTSADDFPVIHLERTTGLDDRDQLHAVEVRLRVSAGGNVAASFAGEEKLDLPRVIQGGREFPWLTASTVQPGDQTRTYVLRQSRGLPMAEVRHIIIRPTDVAGAQFAIESIRLVTRREHLAAIPSGVGWQGLSEIYRESLVGRVSETIAIPMTLPRRPWLDLGLGTVDNPPVTFKVEVHRDGEQPRVVLERTVTTPHRWEDAPIDLRAWAGQKVTLSLSLAAADAGTLGLWGSPVVRDRAAPPEGKPQGVILIWADTLRRDHLDMYGYARQTAPILHRMADDGALFTNCISQATWTKVSTPSLFTSLYPTSHTVKQFTDRLPATANTIAESYREAGYATLSMSSILFTGAFSNMHQGFEQMHEDGSLPDRESSKTARVYVDRLIPWLETHRESPFFVFLHVSDPHDPYRPAPPYDTMWADPAKREEHEKREARVKEFIAEPLMKRFGMPTRDELVKAGIDPEAYADHNRDWYDGSIRAMDAEIGRLVESLRANGLAERTLLVLAGDHGEEFFEHGKTFHGQSVYGELTNTPLMMWGPGVVPAGRKIDRTVRIIDVMPTLLEMSGLRAPEGLQGRSLWPLLSGDAERGGLSAATTVAAASGSDDSDQPAISEKAETLGDIGGAPPPHATESFAIVLDGWKLIQNTKRQDGRAEFELYDSRSDLLDQHDVAGQHPEVVERLAAELKRWRAVAEAARLKPDSEAAGTLSGEELERMRSLGYIQ